MRCMNGTENSVTTGNVSSEAKAPAHSKCFGPSSSHSWLHCPYSAKARSEMPDTPSVYARSGTLAHALCELKVRQYFNMLSKEDFDKRLTEIKADKLFTSDMISSSDTYLQTIKELSMEHYEVQPIVYVEQPISYEDICGADGFGTSDCILLGGDTLTVVDYKNGQGVPVSAIGNPQMRLYAYGALRSVVVPGLYDIKKIVMCIVQPNLSSITTDVITTTELTDWIDKVVRPAVAKIQAGCKDRVPGKWCREGFCPNFLQCRAWREKFAAVYADYETEYSETELDTLSNDELGDLYSKASQVSDWIAKIKDRVEYLMLKNKTPVKGWKVVSGRSGNRAFTDVDAAFEALCRESGFDKSMFFIQSPLSPPKVEALVGKEVFKKVCDPYIFRPAGKPAVVPESDPRKAIDNSAASDFADLPETKNEP